MILRCSAALALLLVLPLVSLRADDAAPPTTKSAEKDTTAKSLTPLQKQDLKDIAAAYPKAKQLSTRLSLIKRAAKIDPAGVEPIAATINKELRKELSAYRNEFSKAAGGAAGKKVNANTLAEIAALRARVLETARRDDLSKEMIQQISDPALERLKELVLIDANYVLGQAGELEKRRAAIFTLGRQWEACAAILSPNEDGKGPTFEEYLAKEEEIAAALAMPMDDNTRQVMATNAQLSAQLDPEEAQCVLDLNLTRSLLGLAPVTIDPALVAAARDHSADMEKHNFFSHQSPLPGKTSFSDRAKLHNTSASGENIALGPSEGTSANRMWWHSPGHHKNMLGDHTRVGVGKSGKLWTELFGN